MRRPEPLTADQLRLAELRAKHPNVGVRHRYADRLGAEDGAPRVPSHYEVAGHTLPEDRARLDRLSASFDPCAEDHEPGQPAPNQPQARRSPAAVSRQPARQRRVAAKAAGVEKPARQDSAGGDPCFVSGEVTTLGALVARYAAETSFTTASQRLDTRRAVVAEKPAKSGADQVCEQRRRPAPRSTVSTSRRVRGRKG